jgi:hypothetical protein
MNNLFSPLYENMSPVKIFNTNGFLIVSIPRNEISFNGCFNTTFFNSKNPTTKINCTPISELDQEFEINKIKCYLTSALLYDIYDSGEILPEYDNKYKIGTYALVKSGENGLWVKYL